MKEIAETSKTIESFQTLRTRPTDVKRKILSLILATIRVGRGDARSQLMWRHSFSRSTRADKSPSDVFISELAEEVVIKWHLSTVHHEVVHPESKE